MLTSAVWNDLRILDGIVKNITIEYGEDDRKQSYTYEQMCARWMDDCFENDILNLDAVMDQVEGGDLNLTFPMMINPVTWDAHAFPAYFGRIERRDDVIVRVPSVQLMYFLVDDTKQDDERCAILYKYFYTVVWVLRL